MKGIYFFTDYICPKLTWVKRFRHLVLYSIAALSLLLSITSCSTNDMYEKTVTLSHHEWNNVYKPSFTFNIKDTAAAYDIFFIIRHTDRYNYNNIYINLITKQPGADSTQKARYDLTLATDAEGWRGTGMDDIYEHRIRLTPANLEFHFRKAGTYTFQLEQIMRENPLKNVLNVGLRVEKKQ